MRKWGAFSIAVLFGIGYAAALFWPYPHLVERDNALFEIRWADGTVTEESYASACALLEGIDEGGAVVLERDGIFGTYVSENGLKSSVEILERGELLPMLTMEPPADRLARAALLHVYTDRLYFDRGDWFAYNGETVAPAPIGRAETVFVTGGELSSSLLLLTGAKRLIAGDGAELSYRSLSGTSVEVEGRTRYTVDGGAIVDRSLGEVLIAGEPLAAEICVPDVAACARGALLPCRQLVSLSLPFVGSGPVAAGEEFHGELGYLFEEDGYFVPSALRSLRVRGGTLVSFAFYHCSSLETIDACGVSAERIEEQAFAGLPSLKYLHAARADLELEGDFVRSAAPCGCTVYERKEA